MLVAYIDVKTEMGSMDTIKIIQKKYSKERQFHTQASEGSCFTLGLWCKVQGNKTPQKTHTHTHPDQEQQNLTSSSHGVEWSRVLGGG
jgi:hypothetical protein